jgi:small ligand-binding sensory domain FIST
VLTSTEHAVADHWARDFDEPALRAWVEALRARLPAPRVSLGLVFISPKLFPHASQILEILRVHGRIPLLVGCSSPGLIAADHEFEDDPGLTLALYSLPGAELHAFHFTQSQVEEANGPGYWQMESGVNADQTNGWLVFIDPFHLDAESWLRSWNEAYAPLPVLGGLASGESTAHQTQLYLNGEVHQEGGVALSVGGKVKLHGVISQGCTPIGETWTLTKVDGHLIHEIANRPAYDVLAETFNALSVEDQQKSRGNLLIGLVVNEYLQEFRRGDFLVRNLLGADPNSGGIAVGALPRLGQSIQFHRRDAQAATEDMQALLARAEEQLAGQEILGGCLCCCNGRGQNLFGEPSHDTRIIQKTIGPLPLAGFFCNGEIGPVGESNFLHGYTASLALFVKADPQVQQS